MPRFSTLAEWLAWQETLHPKAIDLGLERVREVARRLGLERPARRVITVGGTNGKGSCVAFLEAILSAGGYRVGAYTSPHLLRYNERIRVAGAEADDATLCQTFARIDAARGAVSLSYFEFGTLAALDIFRAAAVDVAVLEVGLGGRLDAVNSVDSDAAVVTSVALDHEEWLGSDRNSIGWEKAGIFRPGRPAICADPAPPPRLLEYARTVNALLYCYLSDYNFQQQSEEWTWRHGNMTLPSLPLPRLFGDHQLGNAAAALMALTALSQELPVNPEAIRQGLLQASLPGRFQVFPGPVEWILDVAHNPHAAAALARGLGQRSCPGRTHVVLGMLKDKNAAAVAQQLNPVTDCWYALSLDNPRGRSGQELAAALSAGGVTRPVVVCGGVQETCRAAAQAADPRDRIVVTGSFYTVAQALAARASDYRCKHGD